MSSPLQPKARKRRRSADIGSSDEEGVDSDLPSLATASDSELSHEDQDEQEEQEDIGQAVPEADEVAILIAQSSATGVTVAAIPPCSAIRFRNPKVPRYPPPAHRAPCMLRMRGKCDRGVRRKVRHLDLGGCSAILARHL